MDSHKHKKTVNLPGETMHATPENPSRSRVLGNFSNSVTEKLPCPNEEEDSPYNADHVTDSSPTERECRSEELENNINLEVHNDAPIRKSQSLGGGLNWVERTSDADGSDQKISSDESADKRDMELNNSGLGLHDQFLEPVPSDSIRVNSDCEKYMSIFSIGDPLQYEEEHTHHQDDLCLSGAVKSNDCTPRAQPPISKSNSLPNMTSVIRRSPSFTRCSRSVEDLNSLEFGKKKNVSHRHERELQYQERFDTIIDDDDQNHEENLADDTYDEYVGLSKDWIVPASDGANGEKGINGEASLKHSLDEVPPKDFRLKRIEDWVTDLQHYSPLEISEELNPVYHNESSKGKAVMEEPTVINTEMKISPGTEAAKNYISSLNASATAAQLTNLGLVTIPFFSAFVSIKALNLSGNSIVRITAGALPRGLHILNLSRNSISTIEGLRELTRLRVLDLSYNRIVRIGHGLSSCSSLKELYLAGNKISEVEGLHRLLKLNVLDLRFNKISTTKCLGQLAANYNCLQALSLEGNPASKNVGDEPLKKYVQSLLPHLTYYNRQPIKTGTAMKDSSSDRSARLGICAHQIDRGLKKGTHGVVAQKVSSSSSSSVHGRKGHLASHKSSRGSRHGTRPHPPSGMRLSAAAEVGGKVIMGLRNDFLIQRSHSEGNLGAV